MHHHFISLQDSEHGSIPEYMHRDFKLQNMCYVEEGDFFRPIDYGAYSRTDANYWVDMVDLR